MAEIISKDVDIKTIEKMSMAGFRSVQVGVESISQSILKDINKKQNINENFFFIKHAIKNGINIKGANIIVDTPNENDYMIMESINNLHNYRFILNNKEFEFKVVQLCVSNYSRYLKEIKNRKEDHKWNIGEFDDLMPQKYFNEIDRFSLMHFALNSSEKSLWHLFRRALDFYKRKEFSYIVTVDQTQKQIHYKEFSKKEIIKDIIIDDKIQWEILYLLNSKVFNTEELIQCIQFNHMETDKQLIIKKLEELYAEDLIYIDKLNDSVVSIIDIY